MALLEAHNLHKRFGDQVVLEDISLAFEEHRLSGIMGPNGAGKTTCFNVLTGRYKPDRGRIFLEGEDITGLPPRTIARKGISRSFQVISVFDEYTVRENVMLAVPQVRAKGFNVVHDVAADAVTNDKTMEVLRKIGLAAKADSVASGLSYGERRALEIGLALAAEPRLLFLDEPTAGLGTAAAVQLSEMIRRLKSDVTIVIIEHDMHFLFELADVINVIQWGQVVARGTPKELRANKWVQASNLGKLA